MKFSANIRPGSRLQVRSALAVLLLVVTGLLVSGALTAQTPQKAKKPVKKARTAQHAKSAAKRIADSIATARADSILKAERAKTEADSLRRYQDSLARRREDSLKAFRYRKLENRAFTVGERLVFDVNYGFITAGEAVMSIPAYDSVAGRLCYRVQFTVNSAASFSLVYKVEDRYFTFIDVSAIAPLRFEQHIREGSYRRDFIAEFDQVRNVARTSEGVYPIPPYVHDILSAFYYTRTLDFSSAQPGNITELHNFYKDKSYDLGVKFLGRQELEVKAGTFRTIVVEPLVKEGGLFKSEGRIVIWLTDDERKIPVRVNTKVIIGSIDSELREYSGLAGPLPSRIE